MRLQLLEQDIRRNFKERIADEENRQSQVILSTGHMQIGRQLIPVSFHMLQRFLPPEVLHFRCLYGRGTTEGRVNSTREST
jgi:hypothetical protein